MQRQKWLSELAYAELVALCQLLPGPARSQVGIALGLHRRGLLGAVAAWLGFILPSAAALMLFAVGFMHLGSTRGSGWLHGLKVVAVAVVALALWGIGKTLCPDPPRASFAVAAMTTSLAFPTALTQILVILLPLTADLIKSPALKQFETFYRAGSLVFGGGHVVLPLLQAEVVPQGWVTNDTFLTGYGAAQAVPGPLFTFASYMGAVSSVKPTGVIGAGLCLIAIFLPAFLLIIGVLPFWENLRCYQTMQSAIRNGHDFAMAVGAFLLHAFWKVPPWLVVVLCATVGNLLAGF